jgi:Ca2+-binding EF-hand superfamily protein
MISSDGQTISYDDFIHSMDDNIRKRKASADSGVEDAIMKKLKEVLDYSGESFFEAMRVYDLDGSETINVSDLARVFKRLGISTIEPYVPYLLQVGGVRPKDQKIDIITFQQAIMKEMNIRNSRSKKLKQEVLNKLHSVMKSKELTVFDLFVRLDANHSGNLDKIELRSGIAQMGMNLSSKEFEILWKAVYGRRNAKPAARASSIPGGNKNKEEQTIGYQDLLKTFYKAGCIKLQHQVDRSTTLMTKFRQ